MIKEGSVQLDSYRLAQYSVQVPCYICEGGNSFDAELCRHCSAPMALAHQANTQKIAPAHDRRDRRQRRRQDGLPGHAHGHPLAAIGPPTDAGPRRVLDHLTANHGLGASAGRVSAQDAQRTRSLELGPRPVRSPSHRRPVDLIMPDLAGEALLEEIDHPHTYPVIRSLLSKCSGVLMLVDTVKLQVGHSRPGLLRYEVADVPDRTG